MTKYKSGILILISILVLTTFMSACLSNDKDDSDFLPETPGSLPVYQIGDKWVHQSTMEMTEVTVTGYLVTETREVIAEEVINQKDCYVTETTNTNEPPLRGMSHGISSIDKSTMAPVKSDVSTEIGDVLFQSTVDYSYTYSASPYPLALDKTWEVTETANITTSAGDETETETETVIITYSYEVEAIEDITVPAGTFTCFKIVTYVTYVIGDEESSLVETSWFADETKEMVKAIYHIDHEVSGEVDLITELAGYSVTHKGKVFAAGFDSIGDETPTPITPDTVTHYTPITPDWVIDRVEVEDEQNAFFYFDQAVKTLPTALTDDDIDELIGDDSSFFALIEEGLNCPYCEYPLDPYDYSTELSVDVFSWIAVSELFSAKAKDLLAQGKEHDALQWLINGAKVGNVIESCQAPLLYYLVGVAVKDSALDSFREILADITLPGESLGIFVAELDTLNPEPEWLVQKLEWGKITALKIIDDFATGKISSSELMGDDEPFGGDVLIRDNLFFNLDETKQMIGNTYDAWIENALKPCSEMEYIEPLDFGDMTSNINFPNPVGKILYSVVVISLEKFLSRPCDDEILVSATKLLTAIRCYYNDHGVLPDTLDHLVPDYLTDLPKNPFGGKIEYSHADKTIHIENETFYIEFDSDGDETPDTITFGDVNVEDAVYEELNIPRDQEITPEDLLDLTYLGVSDKGVKDLSGLEYCTHLLWLS